MAAQNAHAKTNLFHRTLQLHVNCGADVLREFVNMKLFASGRTLKEHLNDPNVSAAFKKLHPKVIKKNQFSLLYPDPLPKEMDVTLLSCMILNGKFNLSADEEDFITKLRSERNDLCHLPHTELPDDSKFNKAKNIILAITKGFSKVQRERTVKTIDEIEKKEVVICLSNQEIMKIRGESFMIKLVTSTNDEQADSSDTTYIRFSLTKWIKPFTKSIDIDNFLETLKQDSVIAATDIKHIQKFYSKKEQCNALILKVIDMPDFQLHKYLRCLRKMNENLADLVENKADDGILTDRKIEEAEGKAIRDVIRILFGTEDESEITFVDAQEIVEYELRYDVEFSELETILVDEFDLQPPEESDFEYSFKGICLTEKGKEIKESCCLFTNTSDSSSDIKENNDKMVLNNCNFLNYLQSEINEIQNDYGDIIKEAFTKECVSLTCFSNLSYDEIHETVVPYLGKKRMIMGVKKRIQGIQSEILTMLKEKMDEESEPSINLRPFDSTSVGVVYKKGKVKFTNGNLLEPVHEFKMLPSSGVSKTSFFIRESVKFISACFNSRRNGTIHFGIDNYREIQGIQVKNEFSIEKIEICLAKAVVASFSPGDIDIIRRCVRPFQVIRISKFVIVIELDVVPSSWKTGMTFCETLFPPKGRQGWKFFVYNEATPREIISVPKEQIHGTKRLYEQNIKEREKLENTVANYLPQCDTVIQNLRTRLTDGFEYCTDRFKPIFCCGNMSHVQNKEEIREQLSTHLTDGFLSSAVVFEFDTSVALRKAIEKDSPLHFRVNTTETEIDFGSELLKSFWIYCNGNEELNIPALPEKEWFRGRFTCLKRYLAWIRQMIPRQRAILIFLVFDELTGQNPMLELADICMNEEFINECVVITENESNTKELKNWIKRRMTAEEDLEKHFFSGLSWKNISQIFRSVFKPPTNRDIRLPCSDGREVFLSKQGLLEIGISDIEILSGKLCQEAEEAMDDEERRKNEVKEKEKFYRGEEASWWNFHYTSHVGERKMFNVYLRSVRRKLQQEKDLIETEVILHQPGAGGTTAGKYLLWHLSQFKYLEISKSYRCCIIKEITVDTSKQLYEFLSYEDSNPKPVVALIDNLSEDAVDMLKFDLDEIAYKKHKSKSNMFCLLIIIKRKAVSHCNRNEQILGHTLNNTERTWFECKYNELEKEQALDVNSLISFNVMRKGFDKRYVDDLAKKFLDDIYGTELDILKCLALIHTFDSDNAIPLSIFDFLRKGGQSCPFRYYLEDCMGKGPRGLVYPMEKEIEKRDENVWDVGISTSLSLLIKRTQEKVCSQFHCLGVMILSQALAKALLDNILVKENTDLPKVIEFVLELQKEHNKIKNPISKEFVRIVSSLFKTRQLLSEKEFPKAQFSEMVLKLRNEEIASDEDVENTAVIKLTRNCFDATKDAMVGQQLSRLFIDLKEFEKAEDAIKESIELQPKSPYLLNTYGQVFFAKMTNKLSHLPIERKSISNQDASHLVKIAFKAIDQFINGQTLEKKHGDSDGLCSIMLIKTFLGLLESFHRFSCQASEEEFIEFLNNPDIPIEKTDYRKLGESCPVEQLRLNQPFHYELETSLRILEERQYQVKASFYPIRTSTGEPLLLDGFRERYERFYGNAITRSDLKFKYGVGLKSVMRALKKDRPLLQKKVEDASCRIKELQDTNSQNQCDKRDILIVLGYEIIQMSLTGIEKSSYQTTEEKYDEILDLAANLLSIERKTRRPHLEAYLYFTILNWPTETRSNSNICKPETLKNAIKDWKAAFDRNFNQDPVNKRYVVPKTYFAFGNRSLGREVVDVSIVEKEWRKKQNIKRNYVKNDQGLNQQFAKDVLKRFDGILIQDGTAVTYEFNRKYWEYYLHIDTYNKRQELGNRKVTFILIFTWAGPRAHEIQEHVEGPCFSKKGSNGEKQLTVSSDTRKLDMPHSKVEKNTTKPESLQKGINGNKQKEISSRPKESSMLHFEEENSTTKEVSKRSPVPLKNAATCSKQKTIFSRTRNSAVQHSDRQNGTAKVDEQKVERPFSSKKGANGENQRTVLSDTLHQDIDNLTTTKEDIQREERFPLHKGTIGEKKKVVLFRNNNAGYTSSEEEDGFTVDLPKVQGVSPFEKGANDEKQTVLWRTRKFATSYLEVEKGVSKKGPVIRDEGRLSLKKETSDEMEEAVLSWNSDSEIQHSGTETDTIKEEDLPKEENRKPSFSKVKKTKRHMTKSCVIRRPVSSQTNTMSGTCRTENLKGQMTQTKPRITKSSRRRMRKRRERTEP